MNNFEMGPSPEKKELTQEQEEQAAYWLEKNKYEVEEEIKPEDRRECGPEVAELEELFTSFETAHNLEELHLFIDLDLTPENAPENLAREAAKRDLVPIVELLNKLKEETDISNENHNALKVKYRRFSQAVGILHEGLIDHTR